MAFDRDSRAFDQPNNSFREVSLKQEQQHSFWSFDDDFASDETDETFRRELPNAAVAAGWGKWAGWVLKKTLSAIPGIGTVFDICDAIINFAMGNYVNAAIALISAMPFAGDAIAIPLELAIKLGKKLPPGMLNVARKAMDDMIRAVDDACHKLYQGLEQIGSPTWVLEELKGIRSAFTKQLKQERNKLSAVPTIRTYRKITDHPNYPSRAAWKPSKWGRKESVAVNNTERLEELNANAPGKWVKVYHDGVDAHGAKKSLHYFFNETKGVYARVKTKNNWSN